MLRKHVLCTFEPFEIFGKKSYRSHRPPFASRALRFARGMRGRQKGRHLENVLSHATNVLCEMYLSPMAESGFGFGLGEGTTPNFSPPTPIHKGPPFVFFAPSPRALVLSLTQRGRTTLASPGMNSGSTLSSQTASSSLTRTDSFTTRTPPGLNNYSQIAEERFAVETSLTPSQREDEAADESLPGE